MVCLTQTKFTELDKDEDDCGRMVKKSCSNILHYQGNKCLLLQLFSLLFHTCNILSDFLYLKTVPFLNWWLYSLSLVFFLFPLFFLFARSFIG